MADRVMMKFIQSVRCSFFWKDKCLRDLDELEKALGFEKLMTVVIINWRIKIKT